MAKAAKKTSEIPVLIGLFIMFVFGWVCPTWATVTREGLLILGAFVGWLILVIAGRGMVVAGGLGFLALIISGYGTPKDLFAAGFGSVNTILMIYTFIFATAFTDSGAGEKIVRYVLSRKILSGKPWLFTFLFITIMCVVSLIAGLVPVLLLTFGLGITVAKLVGYEPQHDWCRFLFLSVVMLAGTASAFFPFKGGALMNLAIIESYLVDGVGKVDHLQYMVFAALNQILAIVLFLVYAKVVMRMDLSALKKLDVDTIVGGMDLKLNTRQLTITIVMIIAFLYPALLMVIPADTAAYAFFNNIGHATVMGASVCALALVKIGGEPVINVEKVIGPKVMWGAVWAMAYVTCAASAVASDMAGIKTWLAALLESTIGALPFTVILLLFTLIVVFLTQVFSNMATAAIVSAVVAPMVPMFVANSINITPLACMICAGVMTASITPGGSAFSAMMLAEPTFSEGNGSAWAISRGSMLLLVYTVSVLLANFIFQIIF